MLLWSFLCNLIDTFLLILGRCFTSLGSENYVFHPLKLQWWMSYERWKHEPIPTPNWLPNTFLRVGLTTLPMIGLVQTSAEGAKKVDNNCLESGGNYEAAGSSQCCAPCGGHRWPRKWPLLYGFVSIPYSNIYHQLAIMNLFLCGQYCNAPYPLNSFMNL